MLEDVTVVCGKAFAIKGETKVIEDELEGIKRLDVDVTHSS